MVNVFERRHLRARRSPLAAALLVAAGVLTLAGLVVAIGAGSQSEALPQAAALRSIARAYQAAGGIPVSPTAAIRAYDQLASAGDAVTIPRAHCQPGDLVETGLQGQVPVGDRLDGRAAKGYHCNLSQVGSLGDARNDATQHWTLGWANFDTYANCAYYSNGDDPSGGGTVVLDVSDPAHPVQTAFLTAPAMQGPWESLRVNATRGLLVADHKGSNDPTSGDPVGSSPFAVYSVKGDCAHPKLLYSGSLPHAVGHEGWFEPDGQVYYASAGGTPAELVPVDLRDPSHPKELGVWPISTHGGSTSDDGKQTYACVIDPSLTNPSTIDVLDTSQIAAGKPQGSPHIIGRVSLPDTSACQQTYPVTYGTHRYLIQFGELPTKVGCPSGDQRPNFSRPHLIDISDPARPRIVSIWENEVSLPQNCAAVAADRTFALNQNLAALNALFVYGTHQCTPDRLHDPTLLACAEFHSGLRVYDIRDPFAPREIAYWNDGTLSPTDATVDVAPARPVIRADLGEVWFQDSFSGFHVLKFEDGVYPFKQSLACARTWDYLFAQYDLAAHCPGATSSALACRRVLVTSLTALIGRRLAARTRRATISVNGRHIRTLSGSSTRLRRPFAIGRVRGRQAILTIVLTLTTGNTVRRTRRLGLCPHPRR
jgi:hypothetical protein